jgi:hypothetical protein
MTKAKITARAGFSYAPEGHTTLTLPWGTEIEGRYAQIAIDMGKAVPVVSYATKVDGQNEFKATAPAEDKPKRKYTRKKAAN